MVNAGSEEESQAELDKLKATANNLAQCLHALQQRMDELEMGRTDNHNNKLSQPINHIEGVNDGAHTSGVKVCLLF